MALFSKSYDNFLGYALSGGGAKGFAHLGALKVLDKCGLKPDVIASTSAGSIVGVLYADGFHPEEIGELFKKREFRDFLEFSISKAGFLKSSRLHDFLKNNLRAKSFEELKTPLYVITTDWNKARTVAFSHGDNLVDAVVASCSIPVIFNPQYIEGDPYVDGGLLKNFPVSIIRKQCRYVIGVNVAAMIPPPEKHSIRNVIDRTFNLMSNSNTIIDKSLCDILIEIKGIEKYKMFDLNNMDTISEIGYHQTVIKMNQKDSWRIVDRSHKHFKRLEHIHQKLELIRKRINYSSETNTL